MTGEEIRQALRRTWNPFFARFGSLTEVQLKAIPSILAGRNTVVISPAASGKTEAVVAPVVETLLPFEKGRLGVLYVSPTRALVNDLYRRLGPAFEYLELPLGRKTGDHPTVDEKKLPFLLITTPESFDSLLCRHTRVFSSVSTVILDELHLLDNTPRGDQLRALLGRLRLINPHVRCHALSATIDDENIGARYFSDPSVVEVPGRREIVSQLKPMGDDWPQEVVAALVEAGCRKVLCFFNARSGAEAGARQLNLPPFSGRTWVHHGSMNRERREAVEAAMNRERTGLVCCTSTLELGIDIGDIDGVVLVRPPFNVSSLLQRLGRGNRRRQSELFVIGVYADPWEKLMFETLLDCARAGRLYEKRYTPGVAVLPQQILSYLFQRRRIGTTLPSLYRVLEPLAERQRLDAVFRQLIDRGETVAVRPGIYQCGPAAEQLIELGKIHSNIQDKTFGEFRVIDVTTNRTVGTVFYYFKHFVLAGRSWELVKENAAEKTLLVRPLADFSTNTRVFEGTGTGGYSYRLAPVLKARLFPELAANEFPCFWSGGQLHILHLLGVTNGYLVAEALAEQGLDCSDIDGKLLVVRGAQARTIDESFPVPQLAAVRDVVERNLTRFEDSLGSGAFFRHLPRELQVEDHLLALDGAGLLEYLSGLRLKPLPADEVIGRIAQRVGKWR